MSTVNILPQSKIFYTSLSVALETFRMSEPRLVKAPSAGVSTFLGPSQSGFSP